MKGLPKKVLILFLLIFLQSFQACSLFSKKGPSDGLADRNQAITVDVSASKLDIFDAASLVLINHAFSITTTNERIGLIATDYKEAKKTFGDSFMGGIFGFSDLEIMLTTNIQERDGFCLLSVLPKGRVKKSNKLKSEYDEIKISQKYLENIVNIANEIKELAELSGPGESIIQEKPQRANSTKNQIQDGKISQTIIKKDEEIQKQFVTELSLRVKAEKANIRFEPSTKSPILRSVGLGTLLRCIEQIDNWYKIVFKDKEGFEVMGYIYETLVEVLKR